MSCAMNTPHQADEMKNPKRRGTRLWLYRNRRDSIKCTHSIFVVNYFVCLPLIVQFFSMVRVCGYTCSIYSIIWTDLFNWFENVAGCNVLKWQLPLWYILFISTYCFHFYPEKTFLQLLIVYGSETTINIYSNFTDGFSNVTDFEKGTYVTCLSDGTVSIVVYTFFLQYFFSEIIL